MNQREPFIFNEAINHQVNEVELSYNRPEVEALRILPRDFKILAPRQEKRSNYSNEILPQRDVYAGLLINVPVNFNKEPVIEGQEPPHGLGRIAVSTELLYGQPCGIFDAQRISTNERRLVMEKIIDQIKQANPQIVGLNPTCVNIDIARKIADELVKEKIPYVVGGYFSTLDTLQALQIFSDAAAVIKGHGEAAFPEIVLLAIQKKLAEVEKIKGVYKPGTSKSILTRADRLSLNELPSVDQLQYFYHPFNNTPDGKKEASLYETDGCPFNCSFCSSPLLSMRKYERPAMGKIVDDIETLLAEGADRIHFLDDLAFINEVHIYQFYEELNKKGLLGRFDWRGMGRADLITKWSKKALAVLIKTGCYQLAIGVETGSPRILKMINKHITPEQVLEATSILTQHGIKTKGFFIFGFPGETAQEMEITMNLAVNMAKKGAKDISVYEFHPYPGSELWVYLEKHSPGVLEKLRTTGYKQGSAATGKVGDRTVASIWMDDDVQIAAVPSVTVKNYIIETINKFYEITAEKSMV